MTAYPERDRKSVKKVRLVQEVGDWEKGVLVSEVGKLSAEWFIEIVYGLIDTQLQFTSGELQLTSSLSF